MRLDDVIRIVTPEQTYTYRVDWMEVVEPRRVDLLNPTAARSLTLITCYPFEFVGVAPRRFVVRARQVEDVAGIDIRGDAEHPFQALVAGGS